MITIQSGKLTIPEQDRFVGFAGDNLGNTKTFVLPSHGSDNGTYSLCLRFDDDSVRVIPLAKSLSSGDLVLTWNIRSEHLLKAGIVMAQIKTVDSNNVVLHTNCDYFVVANSAEHTDDGSSEYVERGELEERMTAFLEQIRDSAPYIGDDGYWYVYDVESDSYVRSVKASADITVDSALVTGGSNPVQGGAIKAYIDSGMSSKVNASTTVAGLPLSGNISRSDLAENLAPAINPPLVVQGETLGYGGQYGKTYDGKPMMCELSTAWIELATAADVSSKMELAPLVSYSDIGTLTAGQLFTCQSGVALKTSSGYTELARVENVYTKSEINSMIGSLETLLSRI